MSTRGHWLEAAVASSLLHYQHQGIACVQKIATPSGRTRNGDFFRSKSTVDYVGVWRGFGIAFDCKVTKRASFEHYNVHQHQLDFLRRFRKAGGLAALLIAFEDRGAGSFLVDVDWYDDVINELDHRASIPFTRFEAGSNSQERCYEITHGRHGFAVPLADAIEPLIVTRQHR